MESITPAASTWMRSSASSSLGATAFSDARMSVRDAVPDSITTAALSEHALRTLRAHDLIIDFVDQRVQGMGWSQITGSRELHGFLVRLVKSGAIRREAARDCMADAAGRSGDERGPRIECHRRAPAPTAQSAGRA